MRYIRFVLTILVTIICLSVYGQTQQGYVKTLGRPNVKGTALSDVIIKIKGEHNPVKSNGDGVFSIQFQNKKIGDAYTMQEVRKVGYELNEPEVIGRQFAVSDKVRNTIVMVSTTQLQADKQRIENNAYKVAEKNYKRKLELLEKEKEDGTITVEKYREQLQELQNRFEKYQSLIDGLAEHYAHTDYDELNEKEREINICIENGNLECADSLIQTLFDCIDVLKRNKEALAKLNEQISQAKGIIDQANADMIAVLKQQEKDAEHLYQLYTIALSRLDNDKACFYIESRAELDTTNVVWQIQLGEFIQNYIGNYSEAEICYKKALRTSLEKNGYYSEETFHSYKKIGEIKLLNSDNKQAKEYFLNCLKIIDNAIKENELPMVNEYKASIYSNLGIIFRNDHNYTEALNYLLESLHLYESIPGRNPMSIAASYNSISLLYSDMLKFDEALRYGKKAEEMLENTTFDKSNCFATVMHNIGTIYLENADYINSLDYFLKALSVQKKVLSNNHPEISKTYIRIGEVYKEQGDYTKALENDSMALAIYEKSLGTEHQYVAAVYGYMGSVCRRQANYLRALDFYFKELHLFNKLLGVDSLALARNYNNIGLTYENLDSNYVALTYYNKALPIFQKVLGDPNSDIASLYNNIGLVHCKLGDFSAALENHFHALKILEKLYGYHHLKCVKTLNNIGLDYSQMNDNDSALRYYFDALNIQKGYSGEEHPDVALLYSNIGCVYYEQNDYTNALNYMLKSSFVYERNNHPHLHYIYDYISDIYRKLGDYAKASEYQKKSFYQISKQ